MNPPTLPLTAAQRSGARALLAWSVALLAPVLTLTAGALLVALYGVTMAALALCAVCGGAIHAAVAPGARAQTQRWVIERRDERDARTDVIPLRPLLAPDHLLALDASMDAHLREAGLQ